MSKFKVTYKDSDGVMISFFALVLPPSDKFYSLIKEEIKKKGGNLISIEEVDVYEGI